MTILSTVIPYFIHLLLNEIGTYCHNQGRSPATHIGLKLDCKHSLFASGKIVLPLYSLYPLVQGKCKAVALQDQDKSQLKYSNGCQYRISSVIRQRFFLPKQSKCSRSILLDGSRFLALFRKGRIGIIAEFHRTDLVI